MLWVWRAALKRPNPKLKENAMNKSQKSFSRAQRRYDGMSPPEDRPACEGICGGEADPYPTQHADESDRDYCDNCRAGAEACQRWDDGESEHDDLLLYGEHLLRHIGYEPAMSADYKRRQDAISDHSDAYKDRQGFRPRFDWTGVSTEAIEAAAEDQYMTDEELADQRAEMGIDVWAAVDLGAREAQRDEVACEDADFREQDRLEGNL